MKFFHYPFPFHLELGGILPELVIAYHTFGSLSGERDNAVWVCHGLTANSDVADWWPGTVVEGGFLDPAKHFVVCANILGSHYGTTGPLSIDPVSKHPYYGKFPRLTIRDMANAHSLLADHLGLKKIDTLYGASVGGFQALEWIVKEPDRFDRLVLIATDAEASPWSIAIDESQRMAIRADSTFGLPSPEAGMEGLAAARAIALLSYRGPYAYNLTQRDPDSQSLSEKRRPVTYQRHQGEKLCRRFNAYSYMTILDAFDTHHLGRGRGSTDEVLTGIKVPTLVVGIDSDIIFTPPEMRSLAARIPRAVFKEISSKMGHDGFLTEHKQLNGIVKSFLTCPHVLRDE